MAKKRYGTDRHLREAEVELAKGQTREWLSKVGHHRADLDGGRSTGARVDQVRRLKELERENGRLKK